jgi:flotillin
MHQADGDAYAERTVATAEADAINARAQALDDGNQALIAANRLVDVLPELVEAAARGLVGANLTVLNGSEGLGELLTGVVGQGLTIYESLRRALSAPAAADPGGAVPSPQSNGSTPASTPSD